MQPMSAPWTTRKQPVDQSSLPPVSRGETTSAPWSSGHATTRLPASSKPLEIPIAATPHFPPSLPNYQMHVFIPARKHITSIEQLRAFLTSTSAADFLGFILALNEAVKGHSLSHPCPRSEAVSAVLQVLDTLDGWVTDTPPAAHTLRYGNPAFRTWFARLRSEAHVLVATLLPESMMHRKKDVAAELAPYLVDSFGNETRIDYGTGHETTFIALLYCLARMGLVRPEDARALVCLVFQRYIKLMRRIQATYWLEPAGSHGVWGLDDYQFFPFLWGSAQLVEHPFLMPAAIHSTEAVEQYAADYLYFGAVEFVKSVKKGPLAETSPMLTDIAGVPSWAKINKGMIRMYQAEVLSKLPIMQHFLFGSLLRWPRTGEASSGEPAPEEKTHADDHSY